MKPVVVIPVYKVFDALTSTEKKSIVQCFNILKDYPIYFTGPATLNAVGYQQFANRTTSKFNFLSFEDRYFTSVEGYSELLLSANFYKAFARYSHILLYQPDAYVFKDELEKWCKSGYDYIGSPWFEGWHKPSGQKRIMGVGNGGFSLRKVKTHSRILKRIRLLQNLRTFWFQSRLQAVIKFDTVLKLPIWKFNKRDKITRVFFPTNENEDLYWCRFIGELFSDYKIAPVEEAVKFSFEVNPSYLYELNNRQLPFGCHAWEKYEPEFWNKYIDVTAPADLPENA